MSLLMEALRKAEQGKKSASTDVDPDVHAGERPLSGPDLGGLTIERESDGLVAVSEPETEVTAERRDDSAPEEKTGSAVQADNSEAGERKAEEAVVFELDITEEPETVSPSMETEAAITDQSDKPDAPPLEIRESSSITIELHSGESPEPPQEQHPVVTPEAPDSNGPNPRDDSAPPVPTPSDSSTGVSSVSPAITAVADEQLKSTARNVFTAKEKKRRLPGTRLLFIGLVGVSALLCMAGYLYFISDVLSPSSDLMVNIDHTKDAFEEVRSPVEATLQDSSIPEDIQGNDSLSNPSDPTPQDGNQGGIPIPSDVSLLHSDTPSVSSPPEGEFRQARSLETPPLPSTTQAKVNGAPTLAGEIGSSAREAFVDDFRLPTGIDVPATVSPDDEMESGEERHADFQLEEKTDLASQKNRITITKQAVEPRVDPRMTEAYTAYRNGDLEQARESYQRILQSDPRNRGALFGLAAIAFQRGETSLARDLYLRLLERDPEDPLAKAGLLSVSPAGDSTRQESELKLLIEMHPRIASLSFSLGTLYASRQRWNEAQEAFFMALQAARSESSQPEMVNPDYPFNLAVSLEHLNKPQLAVKYYAEALELAAGRLTGFDQEALRDRLNHLNSVLTP